MVTACLLPLLLWLSRRKWTRDVPAIPRVLNSSDVWSNKDPEKSTKDSVYASARARVGGFLGALDSVCTLILWVCGVLTVYFKFHSDCAGRPKLAYLVQPCHLSNFILLLLSLMPGSSSADLLFEFYLSTVFGALCALATPDTRGLDILPISFSPTGAVLYSLEKVSFFTQHALLVLVPCIWILRRRFTLLAPPSIDAVPTVFSWAFLALVHWDLYAPLSLLTGHNVNYMLVPPGGPLHLFPPPYYRIIMGAACLLFAYIARIGECVCVCFSRSVF